MLTAPTSRMSLLPRSSFFRWVLYTSRSYRDGDEATCSPLYLSDRNGTLTDLRPLAAQRAKAKK